MNIGESRRLPNSSIDSSHRGGLTIILGTMP
jgi:hypothetical protein